MQTSLNLRGGLNRRRFLRVAGTAGASSILSSRVGGQPKEPTSSGPLTYTFVNKTNGKFASDRCFWSFDDGRTWHAFADEPTVACPKGNGRVYFGLGDAPKSFNDDQSLWDFIEYAYDGVTWNGNTTQVDAFCIPITIELGSKKVGIVESRSRLFDAFRKEAPREFTGCVKGDRRIVSPCKAGFAQGGTHGSYFVKYVDEVWGAYARKKQTPSGKWIGTVVDGALTFAPVGGDKPISCAKKPTTQEVLLGTGVLANNPQFCAAINRHVLVDPADWHDAAKFYQAEPCNWYAKFFHQHSIDHKCYGFCYDDVAEQAAYFSGKGDNLIVTLSWD
jgi:hypothetical protein